jgi:exodeoxyribonuclease VII small subunit
MKEKAKSNDITFEAALQELTSIAEKLERGDLSLEDSIQSFERGMVLKKICLTRLSEAEGRIDSIMKNDKGEISQKPFDKNSNPTLL